MNVKVLEVIRKFIDDPRLIDHIFGTTSEYYFKSKGHTFSVVRRAEDPEREFGNYSFYVYPGWEGTLDDLSTQTDFDNVPFVAFHELELPAVERDLIKILFDAVKARYANIDTILSDILGGG
jgi:hypothetical protein